MHDYKLRAQVFSERSIFEVLEPVKTKNVPSKQFLLFRILFSMLMINPYIFLLKYLHDTNNRFFINFTVEIKLKMRILKLKSVYILIQVTSKFSKVCKQLRKLI